MDPILGLFILLGMGIVATALILWRWRDRFPVLPVWSWRNIIALIALAGTFAGAAIITALIWWLARVLTDDADRLVGELVSDPRAARAEIGEALTTIYQSLANNLLALTLGLMAIVIGFGFAITARRFEGEALGAKWKISGGDECEEATTPAAKAAKKVADAAVDEAETVIAEAEAGTEKPEV